MRRGSWIRGLQSGLVRVCPCQRQAVWVLDATASSLMGLLLESETRAIRGGGGGGGELSTCKSPLKGGTVYAQSDGFQMVIVFVFTLTGAAERSIQSG